jgi:WD40 repeat protein
MKLHIVVFSGLFWLAGIAGTACAQYSFNVIRTINETRHQIVFASYNSDGSFIVTAGSDSSLIIWNADRKTIYRTITGLKARPNAAVFSSDNKFIISGGRDNIASLWDLTAMPPKVIKTFEGHKGAVKSLQISSDGKLLATGSADKSVRIWDIQSGSLIYELKGHKEDVNAVAFTPDGRTLVSGGADGVICLWNMSNGSRLMSQPAHKGQIRDLAFSIDGKLLATCGDDKLIYTWQMPTLSKAGTFQGHKDRVQTIDFSPDGKTLISGGWDRLIILWDIASQKPLIESEKQKQVIVSLDISPAHPDFITSCYESENLETWVLSGLDESQFRKPSGAITAENTTKEIRKNIYRDENIDKIPEGKPVYTENKMIQIFSPAPVEGRIVHNKSNINLVGRVADSTGINTFLINKKAVKLSEDGVFQYSLNLKKGENIVDLVAITNRMRMTEMYLTVVCTGEGAPEEAEAVNDISKGRYFALIIGINDYQDPNINDLEKPVQDAESLYNVLLAKYSFDNGNITFLKNPTLDQMITTLEGLVKKLTINDNLLIFFAGHGYWDSKSNIGYWLPSDATKGSTVKWFRNSTLRDFIGSIQTRHTMLIADACFSGAIFKTRAAFSEEPNQGIQKLYELPSRKAMTSGIEEVPDESTFIKYLVKRLDENEEKYLSAELLFTSFKIAVMNNSPIVPQFGIIQNVGDEGGDFIFMKR